MRVLFVHELFEPYIMGGGEIYASTIVKNLMKNGTDVFVVGGALGKSKFEYYKNIPVYRISLYPSRYVFNIKGFFALKKVIGKINPDVIHANTYHSAIPSSAISRIYKRPVVLSVHNLFLWDWYKYFNFMKASFFDAYERLIFKFPFDKIIACDEGVFHKLKTLKMEKRTEMIPYPIDTEMFSTDGRDKKKGTITIGTAGRLSDTTKRTDIFVSAVREIRARYKNVNFVAIGKCSPSVENFMKREGITVTGYVPHEKIASYFKKIDIFIGQGISAKEAMSCGCVAFANESTERILLYHKREIGERVMLMGNMADTIISLIENRNRLKKLSEKSSKFIRENYSVGKVMAKTVKVYEEVLNKHV